MRLALVSPYSWSYPGGVNRHIEALALELQARGHEVRAFAPYDREGHRAALLHRGVRPMTVEPPDWLVPLGGTAGWKFNGAVSNLAIHPTGVMRLRRELRAFAPDVVHIHEPVAPTPGWDTLMACDAPLVGTFHAYGTSPYTHGFAAAAGARRRLNRLTARIAVSEAAAWTGRRFWGGEYQVIPNGVALPPGGPPPPRTRARGEPLRLVFVGAAVARKGLPVLLAAFEGLRAEVDARLTIIGPTDDDVAPLLNDGAGVRVLGRVDDDRKHAELAAADMLVAPSLGGESFGMVLTEAFAAGTPVIASDIAGYRDVVTDRVDGLLVPPGDPTALAEALREAACEPARLERAAVAAGRTAEKYAWPRVTERIETVYHEAREAPVADGVAVSLGLRAPDGGPRIPARRLPPLDPRPPRVRALARRGLVVAGGVLTVAGAIYGLHRIGPDAILRALVHSQPSWVVAALAVMVAAMAMRAVSWYAILRGALPEARPRFADSIQGISIGVLMSATLPARLGEPARALIVARRLGRPRERLPTVLGTLVGQTLINVLALLVLGAVLLSHIGVFAGRQGALIWFAIVPVALVVAVLLAPSLLRGSARSARVAQARALAARLRTGLAVFRQPRLGSVAVLAQLGAWALQSVSCFMLLFALGLDGRAGFGAAMAVLFAVNVSAVLPVTPSNLGVFQAACVAVLTGAYGVPAGDALGYGIILQCVEVATAVVMGAPALVREGMSWRDVRLRTLHASPVVLGPRGHAPAFQPEAHQPG